MKNRTVLSKKEVVVVLLVMFLLFMTLGADRGRGRGRGRGRVHSRRMICRANLRHWYRAMADFTNDNDGDFWTGGNQWWVEALEPYLDEDAPERIWYCPMATEVRYNMDGSEGPGFGKEPFAAWGYSAWLGDYAGSYGVNGWLNNANSSGPTDLKYWKNQANITNPGAVPFMTDAQWIDFWPEANQGPPNSENATWNSGPGHFGRIVQNRHGIGVQMAMFMDGSARAVGLKELWTLKWHRTYNTEGMWTLAGGVPPNAWPVWMRGFQDY